MRPLLLLPALLLSATIASAQAPTFRVILPSGPGAIAVHVDDSWSFHEINLYDDGPRPSLFLTNDAQHLGASYILFANDTSAPTAESCRKAVMGPTIEGTSKQATLKNIQESTYTTPSGQTLLLTSYFIEKTQDQPIHQQNVFAFAGDEHNCAEIHVSKVSYKDSDQKLLNAVLDQFSYSENYVPNSLDYSFIATMYFNQAHNPKAAAPYYEAALVTIPKEGVAGIDPLSMRRILTDQLSMAYGISGNLAKSRAVIEAAIAKDPLYPLYYYNLACADAEEGNAAAARTHLEQAYARRANILKGETMPDASKDDSFLKLKSDKVFWAFVQSLPKN